MPVGVGLLGKTFCESYVNCLLFIANLELRGVAQLVSVRVWGACGRQFESAHPDYEKKKEQETELRFCELCSRPCSCGCHYRGDSDKCLAVSQGKTRWR